ncbi:MAG TPA: hypothetical protein PK668_05545 [Myxococcota bacterium]|nr:hypothetical protein [Myxococcota bacterium]HRY92696.1 hypothetical protein [Myxococcota bacterium]HSA22044.1 hypothetical protein [Myxococcota bacterium]
MGERNPGPGQAGLAVGIASGGLDSLLAVKVVQRLGFEVVALHFVIGFESAHLRGFIERPDEPARASPALLATGARVEVHDVRAGYLPLLADPPCGFGSQCNPCIDCHAFMLAQAGQRMRALGAAFVFSGEVLGQRPMSQNSQSLVRVAERSGLGDRLVRPLSGALLPPTAPEREGVLRRADLLDLSGRGRQRQQALAMELGVRDYPSPAGGCLLTDPQYCVRLRDLFARRPGRLLRVDDPLLLFVGRHLVLPSGAKVVIGRRDEENGVVARYAPRGLVFEAVEQNGPTAFLEGAPPDQDVLDVARLVARYGQGRGLPRVAIRVSAPDGSTRVLEVEPGTPEGCRVL